MGDAHGRLLVVTRELELFGEYLFPARDHTDRSGISADRDVARTAAQHAGWTLGTFVTQRDRHGRVALFASVFDGPDDLAATLFGRLHGSPEDGETR